MRLPRAIQSALRLLHLTGSRPLDVLREGLQMRKKYVQFCAEDHHFKHLRGGNLGCERLRERDNAFPMRLEMKRLAPGETNTWFIEVLGTEGGMRYSTKMSSALMDLWWRSC